MQNNSKRSPIISVLLNILSPGFGYVYLGFIKKWIFLFHVGLVIQFSAPWWAARPESQFQQKTFLILLFVISILSNVGLSRLQSIEGLTIPSASMCPTLSMAQK